MRYILFSSGNIPVDRKSKDRQVLFKGTFESLSQGQAVALFPEGTSYTEPRIMQVKDGAAWASLEFAKWLKENPDHPHQQDVVIVPASIVYTNKSKYRSNVSEFSFSLYKCSTFVCHRSSWSKIRFLSSPKRLYSQFVPYLLQIWPSYHDGCLQGSILLRSRGCISSCGEAPYPYN